MGLAEVVNSDSTLVGVPTLFLSLVPSFSSSSRKKGFLSSHISSFALPSSSFSNPGEQEELMQQQDIGGREFATFPQLLGELGLGWLFL